MRFEIDEARVALQREAACPVHVANDPQYANEISTFNTTVRHTPELVVAVDSEAAVLATIGFAQRHGFKIAVQGAGHGGHPVVKAGILISTRALDRVSIDPALQTATVGAGVRWAAVVEAAAQHGLMPITGSSPLVGVAGFVLGGGIGPLARSHGWGSDHLIGARIAVASGEVLAVDAQQHPELLWALRGGKPALGVITELTLKLAPLRTLYAGALYFEEKHMETAFHAWLDWTSTADPRVSTSAALAQFPPFESVPAAFRGKRLMALRFAFPGPSGEGAKLAEPLRTIAPVYADELAEMKTTDIARIHNDPTQPAPVWVSGLMIDRVDSDFAAAFLELFDPKNGSPFVAGEVRQLGAATQREVRGGSAVGGRMAGFVIGFVGLNAAHFESVLPQAADRIAERLAPWRCKEANVNFMGAPRSDAHYATAWSPATFARLRELERAHDPSGIFKLPSF